MKEEVKASGLAAVALGTNVEYLKER